MESNAVVNNRARAATRIVLGAALGTVLLAAPLLALAQTPGLPAFTSTPTAGGGQNYSLSLQTLLLLTALSFLPAVLLMMTGFTRIIIVLSLLGRRFAPRGRTQRERARLEPSLRRRRPSGPPGLPCPSRSRPKGT